MQSEWLKKQDNAKELIIVFGGWAIGPSVFSHLQGEEDILFLSDYRSLTCDLPDISNYQKYCLIAWSFGVAAFGHWQRQSIITFDRKVALCGSPSPVDRKTGIHPVIFRKTVEGLNDETYQDFRKRCFNEKMPHQKINVEERREELVAVEKCGPSPEVSWDKIVLASDDAIFPIKNLQSAFENQLEKMIILESPHVPFLKFKTWQEVLF